ncbi:hypothetical protein [Labrys monachus]|uniref:Uncharacterized protein n=1 Tax=Labrys monachus TaxID=217067 RepID=A0ABU0FDM7_9HYPH|nr:hypothetical protein [Labrys monachus]MDQ0392264.1 hypothetical protein [Labrys monachus]
MSAASGQAAPGPAWPPLRIGPIAARIEAEEVRRYREATACDGLPPEEATPEAVPATFPAIWLWHPAARAAMADLAGDAHRVPVLIAQRFEYRRLLRIGEDIRFVILRRAAPARPEDVQIEAHIETPDGDVVATFGATYRLFDLRPEAS